VNGSGPGHIEPCQDPEQAALTHAGWSAESEYRSSLEAEGYVLQERLASGLNRKIADLKKVDML
jgi:hypothetical protein